MKKLPHLATLALLGTSFSVVGLAHADTADGLRNQESHEQALRTQTQQIGQQIDVIIAEFDRNGLGNGQDVKTLHAMRGVLGQLSDEQMQKVIGLLQQARSAADGGLNDEKQAFLAQQGILGQFRDLLTQFEKEQSLDALADRFDHLAKQQAANLRSAVDLVQATVGKKREQLDSVSLAALDTQQSEQTSIAGEVKDALVSAKSLLDSASGADADQLNKALAQAQTAHLSATALAAASDLQTGDLFRAASGEKNARDTLRELADLLAPPKDALEMKKDQLSKVESELEKQKEIADQAKSTDANNPSKANLRQTDRAQAANVDDTDDSRRKLENLSPKVAQALKDAEDKMQQARGDAALHHPNRTADDAAAAAATLQQAKEALQTEIAKNEADAADKNASDDKLAQTKQLIDQVKQLREQQKDLAANVPATQPAGTPADQQKSLAAKAQDLQQQAATSAPAAASQLGEAGKQMEKASDSMTKADQPSAQTQQKAADTALAKAQDGLQQQADALQKAQDQLNQLQQAQQQIGDLIKKQAEVALATAQQAQQPATQPATPQTAQAQPPTSQPAQPPTQATAQQPAQPTAAQPTPPQQAQPATPQQQANNAAQQQQVATQTAATQAQIPAQAQQAAAALSDAHQQMQQAAQQLQQNDPTQAQPAQGQAMTDLGKAAVGIATAMDQLKAQLGQPTGDPAAAQAAQDALNQAGQQLQKAQGQLDQAQSGQPAAAQDAQKSLAAAAQAAAQAMGKSDSQAATAAVQQAIAQMNQANGQAQQGQPGPAQQSTAAAQAALAQAQAAMAAAAGQTPDQSAKDANTPPGQTPAQTASMDPSDPDKAGDHAVEDGGARAGAAGATAFVQLPARDRQALQQSQAEKYPQEYGNMVEQYLRNLSDAQSK